MSRPNARSTQRNTRKVSLPRFRRRTLATLLGLLLVAALIPTVGCNTGKTVVATFQGGEVTEAELMKQFHFQRSLLLPSYQESDANKTSFLEEYITLHKVLVEEAKKSGVTIDLTNVAGDVEQYKDQVTDMVFDGDSSKFTAEMKKYDLTDEDIKRLVEDDYYLRKFKVEKTKDVKVTTDEAKAFFDHDPSVFLSGTVSHILVATEEEAKDVQARLAKGEDFATVAKAVSLDPTAKLNGGTMENVTFDSFEQDFRLAAAKATVGQITAPLHTAYGWHILRVDKRSNPTFADARQDAEKKALEDKQNAVWQAFYEQAQQKAGIQIKLSS